MKNTSKNPFKNEKEVEKGKKRFADSFDETQFRATNPNILRNQTKIDEVTGRFKAAMENDNLADIKTLIEELEIACPLSGSKSWTDVKQFNLMFSTEIGSVAEAANKIYLRPKQLKVFL